MKIKEGFSGERSLVMPKVIIDMIDKDPVARLLYITDIGYYPKALHHYRERNPSIDQCVLIYCVDGSGWYEINGVRYEVKENHYFMLPAGVPHTYGSYESNPWTIYWAHFKGPMAKHYLPDTLVPLKIAPSTDSRIANRISLFEEIFNTLNDSFDMENIRYAISALHYFMESLRYLKQYRKVGNQKHETDVIESTVHFLEENIEKHLTLNAIAEYSGFSPSYLSDRFKERTGHSPLTYFNILKMKKACDLLDNTSMKLNQISFKLGIEDPYYFSRLFSKIMGMSPKSYRSQQKA